MSFRLLKFPERPAARRDSPFASDDLQRRFAGLYHSPRRESAFDLLAVINSFLTNHGFPRGFRSKRGAR